MSFATALAALTSLAIGAVAFWYLAPRDPAMGMFGEAADANLLRIGLSLAATIVGVILGSLYRQLRTMQARGVAQVESVTSLMTSMFRSIDMWLALAGSPVVYALLLQSTGGMNLPGLIAIALENGFCCLIIVNGFVAQNQERAQPRTSSGKRGGKVEKGP